MNKKTIISFTDNRVKAVSVKKLLQQCEKEHADAQGTGKRSNPWNIWQDSHILNRLDKTLVKIIDYAIQFNKTVFGHGVHLLLY